MMPLQCHEERKDYVSNLGGSYLWKKSELVSYFSPHTNSLTCKCPQQNNKSKQEERHRRIYSQYDCM